MASQARAADVVTAEPTKENLAGAEPQKKRNGDMNANESCACDSRHIYVHGAHGLTKVRRPLINWPVSYPVQIGTGRGGTVQGHVYKENPAYRLREKVAAPSLRGLTHAGASALPGVCRGVPLRHLTAAAPGGLRSSGSRIAPGTALLAAPPRLIGGTGRRARSTWSPPRVESPCHAQQEQPAGAHIMPARHKLLFTLLTLRRCPTGASSTS